VPRKFIERSAKPGVWAGFGRDGSDGTVAGPHRFCTCTGKICGIYRKNLGGGDASRLRRSLVDFIDESV